jgi:hypothetical protein
MHSSPGAGQDMQSIDETARIDTLEWDVPCNHLVQLHMSTLSPYLLVSSQQTRDCRQWIDQLMLPTTKTLS